MQIQSYHNAVSKNQMFWPVFKISILLFYMQKEGVEKTLSLWRISKKLPSDNKRLWSATSFFSLTDVFLRNMWRMCIVKYLWSKNHRHNFLQMRRYGKPPTQRMLYTICCIQRLVFMSNGPFYGQFDQTQCL